MLVSIKSGLWIRSNFLRIQIPVFFTCWSRSCRAFSDLPPPPPHPHQWRKLDFWDFSKVTISMHFSVIFSFSLLDPNQRVKIKADLDSQPCFKVTKNLNIFRSILKFTLCPSSRPDWAWLPPTKKLQRAWWVSAGVCSRHHHHPPPTSGPPLPEPPWEWPPKGPGWRDSRLEDLEFI